jgi:predicted DNA-binding transcriptional regulator AlpA
MGQHGEKRLLGEGEAAKFLGLGVQTLRNRRSLRQGPSYIKIGASVRYSIEDLEAYVAQHRIAIGE